MDKSKVDNFLYQIGNGDTINILIMLLLLMITLS